jgi:hypothetical protein
MRSQREIFVASMEAPSKGSHWQAVIYLRPVGGRRREKMGSFVTWMLHLCVDFLMNGTCNDRNAWLAKAKV